MMKKTYKYSLLALSVLASVTSCSESESLQHANLSNDHITFHAKLENSWNSLSPGNSRSASSAALDATDVKGPIVVPTPFGKPLYLHPIVQDGIHIWSEDGKQISRSVAVVGAAEQKKSAQTRGAMSLKENLADYNNSFGVTAIYKNTDNSQYASLFANAKATGNGDDSYVLNGGSNRWPLDTEVSFHAYAPYWTGLEKPAKMWSVANSSEDIAKNQTIISYTASTPVADQPDLIVATASGKRGASDENPAVDLTFSHALTAVSFAITSDLADAVGAGTKLKEISLEGIPNEGTFALQTGNPTAAQGWKLTPGKTGTYVFDLSDRNVEIGKDMALTLGDQTLMMIPQTLPEGALLKFTLILDDELQTVPVELKNQTWAAGSSVIYKLSARMVNTLTEPEVKYSQEWNEVGFPKTAFAEGDAVGLYVVNKKGEIKKSNLMLTKQKNGEWKTNDGEKFLKIKNYTYFAYYPYRSTLNESSVNPAAETAAEFFQPTISNLQPVGDQSDAPKLHASDFQTGRGVISATGSELVFDMQHQVGLGVLNLKSKELVKYRQLSREGLQYYAYYFNKEWKDPPPSQHILDQGKIDLPASYNFEGEKNKPYLSTSEKCFHILPFDKKEEYKATDRADFLNTAWGTYTNYSLMASIANPIPQIDVYSDYDLDFYYLYLLCNGYLDSLYEMTFMAPYDGIFKLEAWGGGACRYNGGGGYTYGNYRMKKGQIIYATAGGEGSGRYGSQLAGKNGGGTGGGPGTSGYSNGIGGGGASHFALEKGVLATFENNYKEKVLLVAGGAGGAYDDGQNSWGGGEEAGPGYSYQYGVFSESVIKQNRKFGQGWDGVTVLYSSSKLNKTHGPCGGGGGLYGGITQNNRASRQSQQANGGGGTGFVNRDLLVDGETIDGRQEVPFYGLTSNVKYKGNPYEGVCLICFTPKEYIRGRK